MILCQQNILFVFFVVDFYLQVIERNKQLVDQGGSPGSVVKGGCTSAEGREFESRCLLHG